MPYRENSFKKAYHIFVGAIALLYLVLALALLVGYLANKRRGEEGQKARQALCALKSDFQQRLQSDRRSLAISIKFARDNPKSELTPLINAGLKFQRQTITREKDTLDSLEIADCVTGEEK